ncbi:MAG: tetratricopeptide repeat protein [Candidatus Sabulitectum sp.]|nr:tetratricopeptide repeat protein [Candidatus Sabulitectum sp.]
MKKKTGALRFLLKRFLMSIPFFVLGIFLLTPLSIPAVLSLILGGFLLAKPLFALLTGSAGSAVSSKSRGHEIGLVFSIPETRIMQGEYDKALSLYKDMIIQDPNRLEVYLRIMKLAVKKMKQPEIAKDAFHSGLKNLTDIKERERLALEYKNLMTYI